MSTDQYKNERGEPQVLVMKIFWRFLSVSVIIIAAMMIIPALLEAYGSGPPYYRRTTNMDKWQSPIPTAVIIGFGSVLFSILFWRLSTRKN